MRFMALFLTFLTGLLVGASGQAATTASDIKPWPNATMHFTIEKKIPSDTRTRILKSIARINELQIVKLIEISEKASYDFDQSLSIFVYRPGPACSSGFGWEDGPNNMIKISPECSDGSILHEILHALGLVHEQVHPNRTIELIWDRIKTANSEQHVNENAVALTAYDPDSIMHYSSFIESICYSPDDPKWSDTTLTRLPHPSCRTTDWEKRTAENNNGIDCRQECATYIGPNGEFISGQRVDLSPLDIQGLKVLYTK